MLCIDRTLIKVCLWSLLLTSVWHCSTDRAAGDEPQAKVKSPSELFLDAVRKGRAEQVKTFIDAGVDVNLRDSDKWTPLHWAAEECRVESFRLLIQAGADVNATHYLQGTPLHLAAGRACADGVRDLLKAGADVNSDASRYGPTPLHCAAESGNAQIVKLLIEAGAKLESSEMTPLTCACRAAKGEDTAAVKVLINAGAKLNPKGEGPLHWVRSPAVAKLLIGARADVNHRNEEGQTPLHLVSGPYWGPRESEFRLLIAAGADVNARDKQDSTPLHEAAKNDLVDVARVLIKAGANVNARDAEGNTPLSFAQLLQSEEMVTLLTTSAANDGQTALGRAALRGDLKLINELIASGAPINETGSEKKTALHLACANGHAKVVLALIAAKADVSCQAVGGLTPLHLATTKDVAEALLDAGATKEPMPASQGGTPLFLAATNGRAEVVELLLSKNVDSVPDDLVVWVTFCGRVNVLRLLLDRGGDPNEQLRIGENALLVAARGGIADMESPKEVTPEIRVQIAKLLIEAGAEVNHQSRVGYFEDHTALHAAAERGELEMVTLLLKHKADPRAIGGGEYFAGVTPLHLAAKRGHLEVAKALLKSGADVNARMGKTKLDPQKTPLDLCEALEFRSLLIDHGANPFNQIGK